MAKSKMSSSKNMIMSHGIWVALGIVIGIILIMVFTDMTRSKENLDVRGAWSKFKKWVNKNIDKSDQQIMEWWREEERKMDERKKQREEELRKRNESLPKPFPADYYKKKELECKRKGNNFYPYNQETQFELWKRFGLLKGLNGYYGPCTSTFDHMGEIEYVCCPFSIDDL